MTGGDGTASLTSLAEAFRLVVNRLGDGDSSALRLDGLPRGVREFFPEVHHLDLVDLRDGELRVHGEVDDESRRILSIVSHAHTGPLWDALETNDVVVCEDVGSETRWPQWVRRVQAESSVRSAVSYRIHLTGSHRAALTMYSEWPHAFDEDDVALGSILASYCSLVLLTELVLGESVSARRADDVHREIGVALAILTGAGDEEASARRLGRAAARVKEHLHG